MKKNSFAVGLCLIIQVMVCIWLTAPPVHAQNAPSAVKKITGTVTDQATGRPVPGATVVVRGSTNAVASDVQGNFSISAEPGQVIRISSIGFASRELKVGSSAVLNVGLETDYHTLNDVVVVGYGKMKKT